MNLITILGVSIIGGYSVIQILKFYGVGEDTYGAYIMFYVFLLFSVYILQ